MTTRRLLLPALLLLAALFAGCDFNPGADRTGCDGFVRLLRSLPDTVLVAGGAPLEQELAGTRPFFAHTAGKQLLYYPASTPSLTAFPTLAGDSGTLLRIEPLRVGTSRIHVAARDDCDKEAYFVFEVEVV